MWAPVCAVLLAVAAAGQYSDDRPVVTTAEGPVEGLLARSAGGYPFYSFKGVPYAQPPTGQLRFRPPQRHPGWSDVLDASEHGSMCVQFDFRENATLVGSEDCLFANVYTRQLPGEGNPAVGLPVMVYVHGGAFIFGDGNSNFLGPIYLMDGEVVLVTFNYRLGVFGFLTTHDAAAPGNYGMLDQTLLLEWVQDNIAAFGGDPDSVTIFGESAGGSSVSLLVLSPLTKGLFHRAISQSGTSFANFAATGRRTNTAQAIASNLNCSSDDAVLMVECIRDVSKDELIQASLEFYLKFTNIFTPTVDPEAEYSFLPKDPRALLETGDFNLVPWMSGMTEEEGYALLPLIEQGKGVIEGLLAGSPIAWGGFLEVLHPAYTPLVDCGADAAEEVAKVLSYYAPDNNYTVATVSRVLSDRTFLAPLSEEVRLASAHVPVYKYLLDHRGPGRQRITELEQRTDLPDLGVTHTEDLLYLFKTDDHPLAQPGTPAHTMVRFMVSLWTSFARTGRPSSDVLEMPEWPAFTEQSQQHMRLNSRPTLGERLFEKRANFWKEMVAINEPWRHPLQTSCETDKAAEADSSAEMTSECSHTHPVMFYQMH